MKVLIIKQDDKDVWVKLRNLAWHYDKKLFDEVEKRTFDIISEKEENKNKHLHYREESLE